MNRGHRHEIIHLQEFFGVDEVQRARLPRGRELYIGRMGWDREGFPAVKKGVNGWHTLNEGMRGWFNRVGVLNRFALWGLVGIIMGLEEGILRRTKV